MSIEPMPGRGNVVRFPVELRVPPSLLLLSEIALLPLQDREAALLQEAAELLVLAEQRHQEARGVERAVGLALRGEVWTPARTLLVAELGAWLVEAQAAAQAS